MVLFTSDESVLSCAFFIVQFDEAEAHKGVMLNQRPACEFFAVFAPESRHECQHVMKDKGVMNLFRSATTVNPVQATYTTAEPNDEATRNVHWSV